MCSVGDDIDENTAKYMPRIEKLNLLEKKCNKCRTATPCVILRYKDVYCRECFLNATVHKFKSLLGKHRLIGPNEQVLVDFKAGHPSTALLHFLRSGLNLETPKKLRFNPICVFIEDNFCLSVPERLQILKDVYDMVALQGFTVYFASLNDYIKDGSVEMTHECNIIMSDEDKVKLQAVINKQSNSIKYDVLNVFRKRLLIDVAKKLRCKSVFTTETSSEIASHLLTNVSLGRGYHLPLDIGVCDNRHEEVKIVRPLRTYEVKELVYYNIFNNLNPISVPERRKNPYDSIQNLVEKFVTDLQMNYPATVTTVVRTGDKLAMSEDSLRNSPKCSFCMGPIEDTEQELGAAESIDFSHWICTAASKSSVENKHKLTPETVNGCTKSNLCYACKRIKPFLLNGKI